MQPPLTVSQLFWHVAHFFRNAAISWHEQRQHTCLEILDELHHHVVIISSLILQIFCRCGVCGGILATAFNNPFDVVVSRARNIIDYKAAPYKSVFGVCIIHVSSQSRCRYNLAIPSIIRILRTEGAGALFLGFPAKVELFLTTSCTQSHNFFLNRYFVSAPVVAL